MSILIDYRVLSHEHVSDLQEDVKRLLRDGWRPVGGAMACYAGNKVFFYQTMVAEIDG